jgi:OmpA-OmpF porin, OOP family
MEVISMKRLWILFLFATLSGVSFSAAVSRSSAQDLEGCKDYPLFSRMPNYRMADCATVEFDALKFPVGPPLEKQKPEHVEVEGTLIFLMYELKEGAKPASGLQIMRNFENAAKNAGGTVEGKYPDWCKATIDYYFRLGNSCSYWGLTMKFVSSDKEVWAYMQMVDENSYGIQIVEKKTMKQDIVVNAAEMNQGLSATGHVALYDILFDTGKSHIKPQSAPPSRRSPT